MEKRSTPEYNMWNFKTYKVKNSKKRKIDGNEGYKKQGSDTEEQIISMPLNFSKVTTKTTNQWINVFALGNIHSGNNKSQN